MHWIDVGIVVVLLSSALVGLARGLIVEVGTILGAVAGVLLASREYKTADAYFSVFFHKDGHLAMASFIFVFVVVWLLVTTIAQMVRTSMRFSPLRLLDKLGGAAIGLAFGIVTVEVLLLLASGSHDHSLESSIHSSRLAGLFTHAVPGLRGAVPRKLPGA